MEVPTPSPDHNHPASRDVDESISAGSGAHVQNVRIDLGGTTLAVVTVLVAIIGTCGVVMGIDIAERAAYERKFDDVERQERMTELKLDMVNLTVRRAGLVLPGDNDMGPTGNVDSESFKHKGK